MVHVTVGNSLRWSSLDAKTGTLQPTGSIDNLSAEIHYAAMHPGHKSLYVSVTDRGQLNSITVFRIGADRKLTFVRSYDQARSGLLWWVGVYGLN